MLVSLTVVAAIHAARAWTPPTSPLASARFRFGMAASCLGLAVVFFVLNDFWAQLIVARLFSDEYPLVQLRRAVFAWLPWSAHWLVMGSTAAALRLGRWRVPPADREVAAR